MIEVESEVRLGVVVFWIERAVDGTAAGQHLRGTIARVVSSDRLRIAKVLANRNTPDGAESRLAKALRILRLLGAAILAARPSRTLVARHHPLILPAVLWWRLVGGGVVLSVQGSLDDVANEYPKLGASSILRTISSWGTRRAHVLIAGAPVLFDHISAEMAAVGAPIHVLANGVFVEELASARDSVPPTDGEYAVFVGNLASWQGVDVMVAATECPEWPENLPLVVIGDGVDRQLLDGHRLVISLGRLPSAEAARWYAHAMCAISMKRSNSAVGAHGYWPFKLIESAAVGVPIVCSDAPGMKEAGARLGNALIVRGDDPSACASAVDRLSRDSDLRQALASRGREAVAEFDWAAGARVLETAIFQAAERRSWRSRS